MEDFDDLFTDDIVFDDQTLALLDEQEQRFLPQPAVTGGPSVKRQRTANGWSSRIIRTESVDDLEDLPEISVQSDGTYGLHENVGSSTKTRNTGSSLYPNSSQNRRPLPQRRGSTPTVRHVQISQIAQRQPTRPAVEKQSPAYVNSQDNNGRIQELCRQVEELRDANLKIQADLQAAVDIRLAKEGEVTILRNGMEKTAQDHVAQVNRLKAAKEEADAKQLQIQKEMKEEMERLRTQFTFKQHEMETSAIKGPLSVRAKRISKEPPPTPWLLRSQLHGYDPGDAGPSKFAAEISPLRQFGIHAKEIRKQPLPENPRPEMLLGFQNSFISPSHDRSRLDKGKAKETEQQGKYFFSPHEQLPGDLRLPHSPLSTPAPVRAKESDLGMHDLVHTADDDQVGIQRDTSGDDIEMLDHDTEENFLHDFDEIESYNRKAELHRIIFTHCHPSFTVLTFQMLMSTPLSSTPPPHTAEAYRAACNRVLDGLSSMSNDWEVAVSSALVQIAHMLHAAHSITALTALLNLFLLLIFSSSSFGPSLFTESGAEQSTPRILGLICDIIREHLTPPKLPDKEYGSDVLLLVEETFNLLEALCWNIPYDFAEKLSCIPATHGLLSTMLNASQPPWILSRSARVLVFLATHHNLFRHLLLFPEPEKPNEDHATDKDFSKIPLLECLCSCLVDTERRSEEADSLRISVLTFISLLSIAHTDALTFLLESQTLVPSLVFFLSHLATPIWEHDEILMNSRTIVAASIRTLNQTLFLLHHLVFSADPVFDLRHKLLHAPPRQFNGIIHIFIVTLGRLSYADSPDWIDSSPKLELEHMAEMARDLLELVVEGPEGDNVWAVYQGGSDPESDIDDEEKEARLMVANDM